MSFFAAAPHEKERLQYFSSAEGRDDLYEYNKKERRTVLEVKSLFPLLFPQISQETLMLLIVLGSVIVILNLDSLPIAYF